MKIKKFPKVADRYLIHRTMRDIQTILPKTDMIYFSKFQSAYRAPRVKLKHT